MPKTLFHREFQCLSNLTKTENNISRNINEPKAELKEFESRFKFTPWLKYGFFHLKSYSMQFQDLSRCSIKPVFKDLRRGSNSLNSENLYHIKLK